MNRFGEAFSNGPRAKNKHSSRDERLQARTIWISDVHLGYQDCKAEYLLDFLNQIQCEVLYLVGDILDLWAMKRRFWWPASHYQVLLKINELADQGVQVIYVPGNHDEPLRRFDGQSFGSIEVALEHEYTSADGKRWLIMHGDAMDAYINLSWVTRLCGDVAYGLLLFINRWANRVRKWQGRPYFSLAGLIKNNIKKARFAIETYQNEAMEEAKRRGYDGVICGHIHCPALIESNGIGYANTGDWIENCTALMEDRQGQMHLLHYTELAQKQNCEEVAKPKATKAA